MNLLDAELVGQDGTLEVGLGSQRLKLGPETLRRRPALRAYTGGRVIVGIRPEHLEDAQMAEGQRLRGDVLLREALGSELVLHLKVDAPPAMTDEVRELAEDTGGPARSDAARATLVGRISPRSRAREGERLELVVDSAELHFFDPHTGLGIYADEPKGASA
jgi:multiple sugar transport system ATP-binding protein